MKYTYREREKEERNGWVREKSALRGWKRA